VAGAVSDVQHGTSVREAVVHHGVAAGSTVAGGALGTLAGRALGAGVGIETGPGAAFTAALGGVVGGIVGEKLSDGELSTGPRMTPQQQSDFSMSHPD